ncbi:MAG: spore cortex-lytic enzyme [Clostridia bacterium]
MRREQGEVKPAKWEIWVQLVAALLTFALFLSFVEADAAVAWGSKGEQVRLIQQKLKQYGYFTGAVDGVFGKQTYDAVVKFQRKNGLNVDGAVGSTTAAAIGISLGGTVAASGYNESESYLLGRLVHGEARGEPYVGKVAVAAVVLNRVKSSLFPNTISGVIYQAGAFDAVSDGQINLTPDNDSLRAARDALNGWDPSGGCIYYYNPVTATNSWIWSRTVQLSIGKHNFAI